MKTNIFQALLLIIMDSTFCKKKIRVKPLGTWLEIPDSYTRMYIMQTILLWCRFKTWQYLLVVATCINGCRKFGHLQDIQLPHGYNRTL